MYVVGFSEVIVIGFSVDGRWRSMGEFDAPPGQSGIVTERA